MRRFMHDGLGGRCPAGRRRHLRLAAPCSKEDFGQAVDRAGVAAAQAQCRADPAGAGQDAQAQGSQGLADRTSKAYETLQDERMAALRCAGQRTAGQDRYAGHRRSVRRAAMRQARRADGGQPGAAGDRQGQGLLHPLQARPDAGRCAAAGRGRRPKTDPNEEGRRAQEAGARRARRSRSRPPQLPLPKPAPRRRRRRAAWSTQTAGARLRASATVAEPSLDRASTCRR